MTYKLNEEKTFYLDLKNATRIFPQEVSRPIQNFGFLEQYRDKKYTLEEVNAIIATLIMRTPCISGAMAIKISVCSNLGYHHILNFHNYNYKYQQRDENEVIKFLY